MRGRALMSGRLDRPTPGRAFYINPLSTAPAVLARQHATQLGKLRRAVREHARDLDLLGGGLRAVSAT
jgi:hypothetical protein